MNEATSASALHSSVAQAIPAKDGETAPSSTLPSVPSTRKRTSPAKDAFAGACAGSISKTVVAPIERVKLLMQLQFSIDDKAKTNVGSSSSTSTPRRRPTTSFGAWDVTKKVYREEGILAFWRGEI